MHGLKEKWINFLELIYPIATGFYELMFFIALNVFLWMGNPTLFQLTVVLGLSYVVFYVMYVRRR